MRLPGEVKKNGVAGLYVGHCVIDLDGRLCDCKIQTGIPGLDETLLDAMDTMRFSPVTYRGHPQRVSVKVPISIRPSAAQKPAE
jgi:hypothetical protein